VLNGVVSEPYGPGRYEIRTGVNPFFVRYRNMMTGGDPGIMVNVFYVAVDLEAHLQMGSGDVVFTEKRFHQTVRAQSAFDIDFRVCDPRLFLSKIVGMHSCLFHMEDVEPKLQSMLCGPIVEEMCRRFANAELGSLNSNLSAISFSLLPSVSASFARYGLELVRMQIRHIHVNETDLGRLQSLEQQEAEGRMKTDLEKYNLSQIYNGDVSTRTRAEVLTGMPRGPYPPASSSQVGSSLGPLAASLFFLRSLPEDSWRPFVESIARGEGSSSGSGNGEAGASENTNRPLPPIRHDE
jgi:membrane protease subunit (stomatin/prohibitin family)